MSWTLTVALSIVNCIKRETTEQLARKKAQSKRANTRIIIKYIYMPWSLSDCPENTLFQKKSVKCLPEVQFVTRNKQPDSSPVVSNFCLFTREARQRWERFRLARNEVNDGKAAISPHARFSLAVLSRLLSNTGTELYITYAPDRRSLAWFFYCWDRLQVDSILTSE